MKENFNTINISHLMTFKTLDSSTTTFNLCLNFTGNLKNATKLSDFRKNLINCLESEKNNFKFTNTSKATIKKDDEKNLTIKDLFSKNTDMSSKTKSN